MNTISPGDSQVLRGLGVALIFLIGLIANIFFGKDAATIMTDGTKLLDGALAVLVAGGLSVAAIARIFKPNPPITQKAADAHSLLLAQQGTPVDTGAGAGKAGAHWIATVLAVAVVASMLHGCATEPVAAAQTVGQKGAALLGDFNIYEAASLSIGTNQQLTPQVRKTVLDAAIAAKPVGDKVDQALRLYLQASVALAAGTTTQDKVDIAAQNLTSWLGQLELLLASLKKAESGALAQ